MAIPTVYCDELVGRYKLRDTAPNSPAGTGRGHYEKLSSRVGRKAQQIGLPVQRLTTKFNPQDPEGGREPTPARGPLTRAPPSMHVPTHIHRKTNKAGKMVYQVKGLAVQYGRLGFLS